MEKRARQEHQLRQWLRGRSTHDYRTDTCCPDYSCCHPELQAPLEQREHYYTLYQQGDLWRVQRLRLEFLGRTVPQLAARP